MYPRTEVLSWNQIVFKYINSEHTMNHPARTLFQFQITCREHKNWCIIKKNCRLRNLYFIATTDYWFIKQGFFKHIDFTVLNGRMIFKWWGVENVEGWGHSLLFITLFQHEVSAFSVWEPPVYEEEVLNTLTISA